MQLNLNLVHKRTTQKDTLKKMESAASNIFTLKLNYQDAIALSTVSVLVVQFTDRSGVLDTTSLPGIIVLWFSTVSPWTISRVLVPLLTPRSQKREKRNPITQPKTFHFP
jgi:hypothetical protein